MAKRTVAPVILLSVAALPVTPVAGREVENLRKLVKDETGELDYIDHVVPEVKPIRTGSTLSQSSLTRVPFVGTALVDDRSIAPNGGVLVDGGVNKERSALSDLTGRQSSLRTITHGVEVQNHKAASESGRQSLVNVGSRVSVVNITLHSVREDDPSVPSLISDGFMPWFLVPNKEREKVERSLIKAMKSVSNGNVNQTATSYSRNGQLISDREAGMMINTIKGNKTTYFRLGVFGEECVLCLANSKVFFRFSPVVMAKIAEARLVNVEFVNATELGEEIHDKKLRKAGIGRMKDVGGAARNMATRKLEKVESVVAPIIRRMDRKRNSDEFEGQYVDKTYTPDVATLVTLCDAAMDYCPDKSGEVMDHLIIAKSAIIWMNDGPNEEAREMMYQNGKKALARLVELDKTVGSSASYCYWWMMTPLTNCLERAYEHSHHGLLDLFEGEGEALSDFAYDKSDEALTGTLIELIKEHRVYAKHGTLDFTHES